MCLMPPQQSRVEASMTEPDQYGQKHPVETPELVAFKLKEFDAALEKLPAKDRAIPSEAKEKGSYMLKDDFKLMFLRCEVFNVKLAVKRYMKMWKKAKEVFGPEKMMLPLTQNGALRDDLDALNCEYLRPTGKYDPSGRQILFVDSSKLNPQKYSTQTMIRALTYTLYAALAEDHSSQQKGVVFVIFPKYATTKNYSREFIVELSAGLKGILPVRVSGIHVCHPSTIFRAIYPLVSLFLGKHLQQRLKVHKGSEEKVLEELEAFGLSKEKLPTDIGGELVLDHKQWAADLLKAGK